MEGMEQNKTTIAEDVEIVGSIKSDSSIELNGRLNGDVSCAGAVLIGKAATVKGNVSADSAVVLGQVNGNISVKDRIELKSAARLNGDIRAKRLTVEDGVTFVGKSEVSPAGAGAGRPTGPDTRAGGAQEDTAAEVEDEEGDERRSKAGLFGKRP